MKIRTTQPKNNKYYIRKVNGGYNGAVAGKPTISGANVLCNCVGYANGRFGEIQNLGYIKYQLVCNAENFIESAKKQGLKISSTPVQGGIMVWQKGSTLGGGDGAGHVAVVEEVYSDGSILTSESGWNAWAFRTVKRNNSNGRWSQTSNYKFRGCIVNPSVKSTVTPVKESKLTVDGIGGTATVKAMQKYFGTTQDGIISGQTASLMKKNCPSLISYKSGKGGSPCIKNLQRWLSVSQDGIIGAGTVKAWQKKLGVTADGIFGANSMKAWQKFLNDNWGKKAVYSEKSKGDKIMDACKAQADYMKNAKYGDYSPVTLAHSKTAGTCVTYEGCVFQRLGALASGKFVWHNGKGYGDGKVTGVDSKTMTCTYMNNKTLSSLKSVIKKGDCILLDDNKSGKKGSGGHVFFATGEWSGNDPCIWDFESSKTCAKTGKARKYNGSRKVLAIVRLK